MSNINKFLANILAARYGKDVRQSIHDAIHQCYEDGKAGSMDLIARESIESLQDDVSKLNADAITLDSKVKTIDSRVDLLDIKKTTDSTLYGSKNGGARLVGMVGNTVQNGTPTPINPQSMYHTSDVVEMMSGNYAYNTGAYVNSTKYICAKNPIPCKSGDKINVKSEDGINYTAFFWGESGFVTQSYNNFGNDIVVPSGATYFKFHIGFSEDITPDTVGKITLTINGKYVNCFKSTPNLIENIEIGSIESTNGNDFEYMSHVRVVGFIPVKPTDILYAYGTKGNIRLFCYRKDKTYIGSNLYPTSTAIPLPSDCYYVRAHTSIADLTNGLNFALSFLPPNEYQETVTYFLTEKPMMADSVLFNDNGLFKVEHGRDEIVFDGSSDEAWVIFASGIFTHTKGNAKANSKALCDKYVNDDKGKDNTFYIGGSNYSFYDSSCTTLAEWKTKLTNNTITVEYALATPYIEVLDTESQLALHSLKTFDNVTYLDFDSRVKPKEIEVEYGTSKVGAYTLQSLNNSEANAIRLNELAVAMVSLGSEV